MNTENSAQIDFTLQNIDAFSSARWVLEAVFLSSDKTNRMGIDKSKSIDDEYTPGVFTVGIYNILLTYIGQKVMLIVHAFL